MNGSYGPPWPRDLGVLIARIAGSVQQERGGRPRGSGGFEGTTTEQREDVRSRTLTAPALGECIGLSETGYMVPDTLEVVRTSDSHLYIPYTDFQEKTTPASLCNLAITPGTEIEATWIHEDPAPTDYVTTDWTPLSLSGAWEQEGSVVPASRREGERIFLRGAIQGGATTAGSSLFSVPEEHVPDKAVRFATMTDAGPVVVAVSALGVATVGAGPFSAGAEWLLLDSLSWPSEITAYAFEHWGQPDVFFGSKEMDVTYGELD